MGETDGFCKLIVSASSAPESSDLQGVEFTYPAGRILGCHLYGAHAADLIHEACALIGCKAGIDDLRDIIHAHPTLSEVLQTAAHS